MAHINSYIRNCIIGSVLFCTVGIGVAATPTYDEFEVKAAFLFRVLHYIKWEDVIEDPKAPIKICSNASSSLASLLISLKKQDVESRPIDVRILKNLYEADNCNIIYFESNSSNVPVNYLKYFRNKNVLTIGEQSGFSAKGGVLNFLLKNQKILPEVNVDAMERQKTIFNAKFLRIAKIVRDAE